MAWARLDDGFHDHPKVDELSLAAVGLWTLCLTWAHRHRRTALRPGHITESRARKVAGRQAKALIAELTEAGLWEPEPVHGGWLIHDFEEYLPKQRDPEELKESGRKGGTIRAAKLKQVASQELSNELADGKETPSKDEADPVANPSSRASAPAFPSRPDPSVVSSVEGERLETLPPPDATQHPPERPLDPGNPADARCTAHQGVAAPPPCVGCGNARQRAEKAADREAERLAREREEAVRNCPDCEGTHKVLDPETKKPTRRQCQHPRARRTA